MSLALVVVTGDFVTPDGLVPTGDVTFNLNGTLDDPADLASVPPRTVHAQIDVNGKLAQVIVANDSAGLAPQSDYWITERVTGAPERAYYASVPRAPAGSRSVSDGVTTQGQPTLTSASAAFTSNDVGSFVTCPAFAAPVQILAVNSSTVAVLSERATAGLTGLSALIGAQIDLSTLRPL